MGAPITNFYLCLFFFLTFYTSVIPLYQLCPPAEAQFVRRVVDLRLSYSYCEVGEVQANMPLQVSDSLRMRIFVFFFHCCGST